MSGSRTAAIVLGMAAIAGATGAGASSASAAGANVVSPQPDDARAATALYDAARDRWNRLPLRPFATYDATITVDRGGKPKVRREAVVFRRSDNRCLEVGIPLDRRDRPDAPTVTRRCFGPDYAFTFVSQIHGNDVPGGDLPIAIATPDPTPTPDGVTIAHVVARNRPYDVTFAGDETMDGVATEHLALRPVGDPEKHVLRDVWIDPRTDGVVALGGETRLSDRFIRLDFRAHYDEDAGHETLRRVDGRAKAQLLLVHAGADVSYVLDDQTYPVSVPAWTFDLASYLKHRAST